MRPLRLELTAFGPFAGTERIDFAELSRLGLYLVTGPTGAGKSSVFDGIVYALYGVLPGARESVRQPRSDHAEPRVDTTLVLEFEARGSTWRVERWPSRERRKKRGEGTITEPARAALSRLVGDIWVPETSRSSEVTQRCTELVGLDSEQFERVVLLPQGRFERFLHASTAERRDLLRTLFGSEVFERTERLLADQAAAAGAARAALVARREELDLRRAELVHRAATDVAAVGVDTATIDSPASIAPARDAVTARYVELRRRADDARAEAEAATQLADLVAQRTALARRREELHSKRHVIVERERAVDRAARAAHVVAAIKGADEASNQVDDQRSLRDKIRAELRSAMVSLERPGLSFDSSDPQPSVARLARAGDELRRRQELLVEIDNLERQLDAARDGERAAVLNADAARHELASAEAALASACAECDLLPGLEVLASHAREQFNRRVALDKAQQRQVALEKHLRDLSEELNELSAGADILRAEREQLEHIAGERSAAVQELWRLEHVAEITDRRSELAEHIETAFRLVETRRHDFDRALDAFVAAAAPALAARLSPGEPCPVCGSVEHPHLASSALDQANSGISADPERANRRLVEATAELAKLSALDHELLSSLGTWADRPDDDLRRAIDEARGEVSAAEAAEQRRSDLDSQLDSVVQRLTDRRSESATVCARIGEHDERLQDLAGQLGDETSRTSAELADEARSHAVRLDSARAAANTMRGLTQSVEGLRAVLATSEVVRAERADELRTLVIEHSARSSELTRLVQASDTRDVPDIDIDDAIQGVAAAVRLASDLATVESTLHQAQQLFSARQRDLDTAQQASGFETVAEAAASRMSDAEGQAAKATITAWYQDLSRVEGGLEAIAAHDLPTSPPDIDTIAAAARELSARADGVGALAARLQAHTDDLERIETDLADAGAATELHEHRLATLAEVAAVCRGDNARRITLESWVLRARLSDVVDRANTHLHRLSRGRYRLGVAEGGTDRRYSAGLDLIVDDASTGRRRAANTLSGGETFQASLVLALGLADAVMDGRGGLELDTLFIDEGFGTLDGESLDLAVDLLHELRTAGQTIGVVTHVDALKAALPIGVEVHRRSDGRGSSLVSVPA